MQSARLGERGLRCSAQLHYRRPAPIGCGATWTGRAGESRFGPLAFVLGCGSGVAEAAPASVSTEGRRRISRTLRLTGRTVLVAAGKRLVFRLSFGTRSKGTYTTVASVRSGRRDSFAAAGLEALGILNGDTLVAAAIG